MKLKTATLIALIGVSLSFALGLFHHVQHGFHLTYVLRSALYSVPLIIFFAVLLGNQK